MADFENLLDGLQEPDIANNDNDNDNGDSIDDLNDDGNEGEQRQQQEDGDQPQPQIQRGMGAADAAGATNQGQEWEVAADPAEVPDILRQTQNAHFDDDMDGNSENMNMTDTGDGAFFDLDKSDAHKRAADVVVNQLYDQLHTMWQQEHLCPELLAYEETMVQDTQRQLEQQQDLVDELDASSQPADAVMSSIVQLDHDRTKFVLSDLLSSRLSKIEEHPLYMRERVDRMSDAELAYLQKYGELMSHHLDQTVLDHLPTAWQRLDEDNMIDRPRRDVYHFWYVRETIETDDGTENEKGTTILAKYDNLEKYFTAGKVELLM